MQVSLLSARVVFALLVALFAGEPESGALVDRVVGGEVAGSYVATEEAGAVAIVELRSGEPPQAVATLERLDTASHLFAEVGSERVYSLERLFDEEYRLPAAGSATLELPIYPEAMVANAQAATEERAPEDDAPEGLETAGESGGSTPERAPTGEWRFLRSGELLYITPASGEALYVTREIR